MSFGSPYFLVALLLVPAVLLLALWFDRKRARYAVAFTNLDVLATVVAQHRRPWRRWSRWRCSCLRSLQRRLRWPVRARPFR